MTIQTILALSIGTAAMLIPIMALALRYRIAFWKSVPIAVLMTITGTISTYIWFFIEASGFGGRSYYGAVFLIPVCFIPVAKLMKIQYGELMDLCAPAECVMLAIMKYQCLVDGCCGGIILRILEDGTEIQFPSQMVELGNALLITAALLILAFCGKWRGKVYPWYLIIYGVTRFVLNFYRKDNYPLLVGLPSGNVWSLLAIFVGILWLTDRTVAIVKRRPEHNMQENKKQEANR